MRVDIAKYSRVLRSVDVVCGIYDWNGSRQTVCVLTRSDAGLFFRSHVVAAMTLLASNDVLILFL